MLNSSCLLLRHTLAYFAVGIGVALGLWLIFDAARYFVNDLSASV